MSNVIVAGASRGIGRKIVEKELAKGNKVVAIARDVSPLSEISDDNLTPVEGDALEESTGEKAIEQLGDEPIHGFAYCIGTINLKPLKATKEEEWDEAFERNVMGAVRMLKAVLPRISKNKQGSVVLFTSTAARIGLPNHVMISAAKGAVEGLTKALAADLARVKVRVNAIAPGLVDTSLGEQITSNERALEASIAMHPLGRIAKPEEVASLASYLLSDDAEFITGQIIAVDGGLSSIKTM